MPSVSYNEQCFLIDGRPFWALGASMQYCRMQPEVWADRISAAKQAGFNCIETACPWMIHEPRRGRYEFGGGADVRRFVELCRDADMRVVLRLGPAVGAGFDGSGIPGWLMVQPEVRLREADADFLGQYSQFLRKLVGQLEGLAATEDGPILLVQSEHAWTCSNPEQFEKYHRELSRYIRESGFNLPVLNANDLWQETTGTIDTWRGWNELLVNLRQLRTIQPNAPRLVSSLAICDEVPWGEKGHDSKTTDQLIERMAEVLAAGGQFILSPFVAGTNFDFLGGRLPGRPDGFVTTTAGIGAPINEAGFRSKKFFATKRLVMFANQFSHVFAELNADFHPIVLDPEQLSAAGKAEDDGRSSDGANGPVAIVPQRGSGGRVVFIFGGGRVKQTSILLDNGVRLNVHLGDQPVAWFVFDVDLRGSARLDYLNLCPWAIVDRSILVLFGPEKTPAIVSINESPLEATVPGGEKPLVLEHKGITLVICNHDQIDRTYQDGKHVYVGVEGFDSDGAPILPTDASRAWKIGTEATVTAIKNEAKTTAGTKRTSKSIRLEDWKASDTQLQISGESPRYATLQGPETLSECGASTGYGWYRIIVKSTSSRKRLCHIPKAADRLHLFVDGRPHHVFGVGRGADNGPFELKFAKGDSTLVFLADNLGRFSDGNDIGRSKGLFGHVYEVKAMASVKPRKVTADPVDPFDLRGFIAGAAKGILSDMDQVAWTFTHQRKTPIIIDIDGAKCRGTFVLNDEPLAYYAGETGACFDRYILDKSRVDSFKRGKNVLRFAPDHDQADPLKDIMAATKIYEGVECLSEDAKWSFAKWEAPTPTSYEPMTKTTSRSVKGAPCWWRTKFELSSQRGNGLAAWFDTSGLSKGQAYLNGHNLGRFFTASADGHAVGPQKKLFIPDSWLKAKGANELLVFDEHGFDPFKTKITFGETGDFE